MQDAPAGPGSRPIKPGFAVPAFCPGGTARRRDTKEANVTDGLLTKSKIKQKTSASASRERLTDADVLAKADNIDTVKLFAGNRKRKFSNRKRKFSNRKRKFSNRKRKYQSQARVFHIAITRSIGLRFVKRCTLLLPTAI